MNAIYLHAVDGFTFLENVPEKDTGEIWKDVLGFDGLYKVSNTGKIKSFHHGNDGRLIKPWLHGSKPHQKYWSVTLSGKGKSKHYQIHRLMMDAFFGPSDDPALVVDHINGISTDNRIENLQRLTNRANISKAHADRKLVGVIKNTNANTWKAVIGINGKKRYLGSRKTQQEAHELYQNALKSLQS